VQSFQAVLAILFWFLVVAPAAAAPDRITVAVPGPATLSYLPIDLIPRIGADRAEGSELRITFMDGGGKALEALRLGNADVAVAGMPAAMDARLNGAPLVTFAAVDDLPLYVLSARKDLEGKLRTPADLRGRLVGVHTSASGARTASHQLAEIVIRSHGVDPREVRFISVGQSWVTQSAAIRSRTVDAMVGDEPFATRLKKEGQVYFLFNLADPAQAARLPGGGFLHAAAHVRSETAERSPEIPATFARMLRRSLKWLATHKPRQVTEALGLAAGAERDALEAALAANPRAFSRDGRLSDRSLRETDVFFHASHADDPRARDFSAFGMTDTRWAGKAP
jgi:NitT/TauT family transport system substrate-binding protein